MMRLFHVSPVGQWLAAIRGTGVAELVPDPEPEPVTAIDADGKRWVVIAIGAAENRIDHVVFGPFQTEDAAIEWADSNTRYWRDSYEIAEFREPRSVPR